MIPTVLAAESGGGSFLVQPGIGLMVWTLIAFAVLLILLRRLAFPRIADNLDRRQRAIEDSIDAAEHTKAEADKILAEYRERLQDARKQSEDIIARARRSAETTEKESQEKARREREQQMEHARRDIQSETRRAIQQIRGEVADLTVLATEKVTRKSLTDEDQRRLVEEALGELDFDRLAQDNGSAR